MVVFLDEILSFGLHYKRVKNNDIIEFPIELSS
jgi:hypothetical protein